MLLMDISKIIGSGFEIPSKDEINARLDHCRACELVIRRGRGLKCSHCGCFMNLKAGFAGTKCPIGKW